MATKFQEIYPLFLNSIDDYEINSNIEQDVFEMQAENFLRMGLLELQESYNDLTDIDDEEKQFNSDLTLYEKALVAKAMKLEWVREKKYSLDLMRRSIGDRDYKAVQGTEYLKQLTNLEKELQKELRNQNIRNTYTVDEYWSDLRQ